MNVERRVTDSLRLRQRSPEGWTVVTKVAMDTFITIAVHGHGETIETAVDRAFAWFDQVQRVCNRFDPLSEISRVSRQVGVAVPVSPLLFELVQFTIDLARTSRGAFDPTIGHLMEQRGFNVDATTGQTITPGVGGDGVSFRDVSIDRQARTIRLRVPLSLDLNAVAKGLAVDLAARELSWLPGGSIDAGGDLFCWGRNPDGGPWQIGVQHPNAAGDLIGTVTVHYGSVCTSGSYERFTPAGHHLVDPVTGEDGRELASVTVLAPTALAADGLATAAFVLGLRRGSRFLIEQGVEGVFVRSDLSIQTTPGTLGFSQ